MLNHYDVLLVGAGLFNATLAYNFIKQGKTVLVVEKREHIAGNCYDELTDNGDTVHRIPGLTFSIPQMKKFGSS